MIYLTGSVLLKILLRAKTSAEAVTKNIIHILVLMHKSNSKNIKV